MSFYNKKKLSKNLFLSAHFQIVQSSNIVSPYTLETMDTIFLRSETKFPDSKLNLSLFPCNGIAIDILIKILPWIYSSNKFF